MPKGLSSKVAVLPLTVTILSFVFCGDRNVLHGVFDLGRQILKITSRQVKSDQMLSNQTRIADCILYYDI